MRRPLPVHDGSFPMNAVTRIAGLCPDAAQWRERLLSATAQASRLLLESSDAMSQMPEVLRLIGEAAEVDRTTLALVDICDDGRRWLEIKCQWTAPGIDSSPDGEGTIWQPRRLDCFCHELQAGRSVYLCPGYWRSDISIASQDAKSSIIVPFMIDGEYGGVVGLDTVRAERQFDAAVIAALEIAASVIGAALQRERLLETMRREREAAAEQRVSELARANAVLRANLERLASQPTEFFTHLLLETVRHAGADAATTLVRRYESEDWQVVCHVHDGQATEAPFANSPPGSDSPFMRQMMSLREPLHVALDDGGTLPEWPELIDFHRRADHRSLYLLPLVFGERNIGVVVLGFAEHEPLRGELAELLVALAQQVTLAIAMKRLMHSAQRAAVLAERNRLGREIHDGLAQAFTGILMQLGAAEEQSEGSSLAPVLERIRDIAREGLAEARRSVLALRPDEQPRAGGLELALRQLAERSTVDGRISTSFHGGGDTGLPPEHEHALLRIAQEAVTNAVRHGQPGTIEIHLQSTAEEVVLCVRDDGRGMQPALQLYARRGFGLTNMRERAEALGGYWSLESEPGKGTRVSVRIPRAARSGA
jgi:signal transduction histidine kinase